MELAKIERAGLIAGIGLVAGLAGAIAMALSQKAEMAISGREPSSTPAEAIETISGVEANEAEEARLSTVGHFAFGTALGLGLAAMDGVPEPARAGLFLGGSWAAGNGLITALGVSDPPTRWTPAQLATDLLHHVVYAAAATAAYFGLRRLVRS